VRSHRARRLVGGVALALGVFALVAACTRQDPSQRVRGPELPDASPRIVGTAQIRPPPPDAGDPDGGGKDGGGPPRWYSYANGVRTIGRCDEGGRRGTMRFTLAHFNDLQARYSDRIAGKSRYAYLAGYLEKLREEVPSTLVLDAGDDYEKGAIAELRSGGETTRKMIQALPIDVRTVGNHDFAYGADAVIRDVRGSVHPVLAANIHHVGLTDQEQPFRPYVRVDVGCLRVGVIGLVTQNYGADDQPTKKPYDSVFEQNEHYAAVLEREVKAHRGEVDVLVALTHIGMWEDAALAGKPAAKGVDLIVGAHTEDLLKQPSAVARRDGSRTWVLQAGHFARTLGRADLAFDPQTKKLTFERYKIVDVDSTLPVSSTVDELATRLEKEAAPDAHEIIANMKADLKPGKEMVELIHRAAVATWGVDATLLGRDVFWQGLPKGPLTLQRIYDSVFAQRQPAGTPGFSSIYVAEMTGAELTALRAKLHSVHHELIVPAPIDPKRTYHLAIEKRAMTFPRPMLGTDPKLRSPVFKGELIDVLESYARARTGKGETLD